MSHYKYSLDYKEDFYAIKKIFESLKKNSQFGYTNEVIKIINNNPKILKVMKYTKELYLKNRQDLKKAEIDFVFNLRCKKYSSIDLIYSDDRLLSIFYVNLL